MILFLNEANTKKKRVHMKEWQRESRQLKRDAGEHVEDGFGVALPNRKARQ